MKRTRWGIVGTGTMACDFARGLQQTQNAELVAVASRSETRAADFASAFGVPMHHSSYESLAKSGDVDVIHIATPNSRHSQDALLCLENGVPVLCEKPFTISSHEARLVVEKAREKGLFCMEAMWMRFIPLMQRLRKAVLDQGLIGDPTMLVADFGYPVPRDANNRFFNPGLGGGGLLDRGIYPISLACFLLGLPIQYSGTRVLDDSGVDSSGSILLGWSGQAVASLHYSLVHRTSNRAVLYGTEGCVQIDAPFFRPHRMVVQRGTRSTQAIDPIADAIHSGSRRGKVERLVRRTLQSLKRRLEPAIPRLTLQGDVWTDFGNGVGYQFEAREVQNCLQRGELESMWMPLDESIAMIEILESIQSKWAKA